MENPASIISAQDKKLLIRKQLTSLAAIQPVGDNLLAFIACSGHFKPQLKEVKMRYLLIVSLVALLSACTQNEVEELNAENQRLTQQVSALKAANANGVEAAKKLTILAQNLKKLEAVIVTDEGEIEVRFFPEQAPLHVMNFILLAEAGFYNGVLFHRVIEDFMIQTGDPLSKDGNPANDGTGGTPVRLPAEFNQINHKRGVLSMARSKDPNSASSQFFITHADYPSLDNQYTVFGEVTKGIETVDRIATVGTINNAKVRDRPQKPIRIQRIDLRKAD
jgi:peptidyl-prolyl cis-trans isomerase B (cyclophilin B)